MTPRPTRPARPPRPVRPPRIRPSIPEPDPLANIKPTGDLEADAATEFQALQEGYRDRLVQEATRFKNATDGQFWFCVCFESDEERKRFLAATGLGGRKQDAKYVAGAHLAKALGVSY